MKQKTPDDFWRKYEEQTGEKVLARALGRYISGWEEFDSRGWNSIWGLIISTSGGFRFHHFPQTNWLAALANFSNDDAPKEKTFFIPREQIICAKLIEEKRRFAPNTTSRLYHLKILLKFSHAKTQRTQRTTSNEKV
jgi:hypothetical protein